MIYHDGDFFIYDSVDGLRADDLTEENLRLLSDLFFGMEVACYPGKRMLIPTVTNIDPSEDVSLTGFYKIFEVAEKKREMFISSNKRIQEKDVPILFEIAGNIKQRTEHMSIYTDLSMYLADDEATREAYNDQRAVSNLEYVCPNETLLQRTSDDKLHIHLPDDSYIVSNNAKVPSMTSISRPYKSPIYKMYGVDRVMDVPESLRKATIADVLAIYQYSGLKVPSVDELYSSFYMEERTFVFGDPDNNLLEIQPHEQDYYHNLLAFIKHHINLFNTESMKGASRSEIEKRNLNDFNTCNLPSRLETYLYDLLGAIAEHHYSHTGQTVFNNEGNEDSADGDDDDSGDDGGSQRKPPSIGYVSSAVQKDGANAVDALHGYIQFSGKDLGAGVWAEAIVKLLRWGKYKPTSLYVGENNPNEIDLMNFRVRTVNVNLADLEKIVYDDGRSHFIESKITLQYNQKKIGYEIDAIFTLAEDYQLKDGGIHRVRSLITLQDLIREYLSGNHFVDGINFDGTQFLVDINEDTIASFKNALSAHVNETFIPSYLLEMGMNYGIEKIKGMAYALINRSILTEYRPKDENFAAHISKFPKSERANALYGCWVKAFEDTCCEIECDDLEDFINMYYTTIYPKFAERCASIDQSAVQVSTLTGSNFFVGLQEAASTTAADEDDEVADTEGEELGNTFPITNKDVSTLGFSRLYKNAIRRDKGKGAFDVSGNILIGGYFVDKDSSMVTFASLKDGVNILQQSKNVMSYSEALPYLMNGVLKATKVGNDLTSSADFVSDRSVLDIYLAVTQK